MPKTIELLTQEPPLYIYRLKRIESLGDKDAIGSITILAPDAKTARKMAFDTFNGRFDSPEDWLDYKKSLCYGLFLTVPRILGITKEGY